MGRSAASGGSQLLLTVLGCPWLLLAASARSWLLFTAPDCSWWPLTAPGCYRLLLAAPGCSWLLLATPGCAWRLLATPLAATIHAYMDSWGRNLHMTQNISLIIVFGHCARARLGQRERANYDLGRLRKAWACTFKSTLLSTSCHLQQPALLKRLKGRP